MRILESLKVVFGSGLMAVTLGTFAVLFCIGNTLHVQNMEINKQDMVLINLDPVAAEISSTLRMAAGPDVWNVEVAEYATNGINGFTSYRDNLVFITTGLMKFSALTGNKYDFVKVVMAHEFGHVKYKHIGGNKPIEAERNQERQADYYATELLYKSGYGCDIQVTYNLINLKLGGDSEALMPIDKMTHPYRKERLKSAIKNCDNLKKTGKLPEDLYYELVPVKGAVK